MYAGVFFLFGSLGMLIAMIQREPGSWSLGVWIAAFSGLIAMGWAYSFSSRRYWLVAPLMAMPFVAPPFVFPPLGNLGLFGPGAGLSAPTRLVVLAILIVVGVSVGFTLIIWFVRRNERAAARSRAELDLARKVHEALVPEIDVRTSVAQVSAMSIPSSDMGGDLVDVLTREGEVDAFIADVSGHGVAAGLVMGMVKSAIHMRLRGGSHTADLASLLVDLNRVLVPLVNPGTFATFACVRVRRGEQGSECEYALAGHLPIWLYRARTGVVEELENQHLPLAIDAGEMYASGRVQLEPGDTLVMITDGLTETTNLRGEQLGLRALREAVARLVPLHAGRPGKIIEALLELCDEHSQGREANDDRSVMVVSASQSEK